MRFLRALARRPRTACTGALLAGAPVILMTLFPGCQAAYLGKQAFGALRMLCGRVAVDAELLEKLPPKERDCLEWVARVRRYAEEELGLTPGDAYTTYYDTGSAPISTIVVAAHPLALEPYRWRFPLVGQVPYKGYFNADAARRERDRLQARGWDAAALPVRAFSSLGWFSDPLLSGMLRLEKGQLADLLIHEITHRTVYVKGNSSLNESLATHVAREGTERLLVQAFGPDSEELRRYRAWRSHEEVEEGLHRRLRADLDALYRGSLSREDKLRRKGELFGTAEKALAELDGRAHLPPSNALLVLEREYSGLLPLLRSAQEALGGHPRQLVAFLKELPGGADLQAELAARVEKPRVKALPAAGYTSTADTSPEPGGEERLRGAASLPTAQAACPGPDRR